MEVKVYDEKKVEEEAPLLLKLEQTSCGVELVVVDEVGEVRDCGCLLTVYNDGRIGVHSGVRHGLGLKLTKEDRVITFKN